MIFALIVLILCSLLLVFSYLGLVYLSEKNNDN